MYYVPLPICGTPPDQALRAHTGTLAGERIWFIGGVNAKSCWRQVAYLDTESLEWAVVETGGETLPPLRAHTTTLVGNLLYIFGGGDGPTYSNEVWTFDTGESGRKGGRCWSMAGRGGEDVILREIARSCSRARSKVGSYATPRRRAERSENRLTTLRTPCTPRSPCALAHTAVTYTFARPHIATSRSALPPPRRAHTTVLYRNFLVVFGGGNGQAALNDVWALDVADPTRLTWHEWRTTGSVPQKKGYHTANLIGDKVRSIVDTSTRSARCRGRARRRGASLLRTRG
jgi:hypothetical protein